MLTKKFSGSGFVLGRKNYSEADRIINLYTKDYGKLNLLAKGVRRPKSRKRGGLEVFSHINFSGFRGKGMPVMQEVEVRESFNLLRSDIKKVAVAYFFIEVINKLTREDEKNERIYFLLNKYLINLEISEGLRKLRMQFIYDFLVELGFWPKGKIMTEPDKILEEIVEKKMSTTRVGKRILI